MTTFDLQGIRQLSSEISRRLDACDNGEGMECGTLDASLQHYANECGRFCENLRAWALGVFSGKFTFDADVESAWKDEGERLYSRAFAMLLQGNAAEVPCFELEGQGALLGSLWQFYQILHGWVSPKRSVSPSARLQLPESEVKLIQQRIIGLEPFPDNWEAEDQRQRAILRKIRPC